MKSIVIKNICILLILGCLTGIISVITQKSENNYDHESLSFMIFYAFIIVVLALINLFASIIYFSQKKHEKGKSYLLAFLLIILIGFSTCFGGAELIKKI